MNDAREQRPTSSPPGSAPGDPELPSGETPNAGLQENLLSANGDGPDHSTHTDQVPFAKYARFYIAVNTPLAAQHAALAWPPGEGLTIELPVGEHLGERDRVAKLLTALLAQEYQAGWISRASHNLRGVMPEALWPCLAALDAGTSEDFDVFNRWLLDPEFRLSRAGCAPSATTPASYVPVRFTFIASAHAPRVANTHMAVWVALFVAGFTSIAGGLVRCGFILLDRNPVPHAKSV